MMTAVREAILTESFFVLDLLLFSLAKAHPASKPTLGKPWSRKRRSPQLFFIYPNILSGLIILRTDNASRFRDSLSLAICSADTRLTLISRSLALLYKKLWADIVRNSNCGNATLGFQSH